MKKTLAILLALLAATSITLASCKDDGRSTLDDDWNDEDNDYVESDDENDDTTDDGENTTGEQTPGGNEDENDPPVNSTGWETKDDTVYAGVDALNLRSAPNGTNSANIVKQVNHGTKLNRKSTTGKWDKVTLDGSDTEYYVLHMFVSETNANFTFTNCESPVTLTFNSEKGMVCFYTTPFKIWDGDTLLYNNIWESAGVKAINGELKKVALSDNGWIKVTVVGTISLDGGKEKELTEPTTFYISNSDVTTGRIVDPDRPNAGNGSGGGNG